MGFLPRVHFGCGCRGRPCTAENLHDFFKARRLRAIKLVKRGGLQKARDHHVAHHMTDAHAACACESQYEWFRADCFHHINPPRRVTDHEDNIGCAFVSCQYEQCRHQLIFANQHHDQVITVGFKQVFNHWYCHNLSFSGEYMLQNDAEFLDVF